MLAKKTGKHVENWDTYLPQVLGAYRIGISETTCHSPFFLLYTRDPVVPIDNLLRPRRKYLGEDHLKIALERQHEAFVRVQRNLRKARNKQKKYHDRGHKDVKYKVGDAVYILNNQKSSKLDCKWQTHYRIIEQHSEITFTVKHQITGQLRRVHADQLRLTDLAEWPEPTVEETRLRKTHYVVPPDDNSQGTDMDSSSSDSQATIIYTPPQQDSDSENELFPYSIGNGASVAAHPSPVMCHGTMDCSTDDDSPNNRLSKRKVSSANEETDSIPPDKRKRMYKIRKHTKTLRQVSQTQTNEKQMNVKTRLTTIANLF